MSKKRLILGVLLGVAVVGFYRAGAPPESAPASPPSTDRTAVLKAAPGRTLHGVAVVGAHIVAPAVRRLVTDAEAQRQLLRDDLRAARLTPMDRNNAQAAIKQVGEMDSLALEAIREGRPVEAFRQAMQAGGLARAVRENVRRDGT